MLTREEVRGADITAETIEVRIAKAGENVADLNAVFARDVKKMFSHLNGIEIKAIPGICLLHSLVVKGIEEAVATLRKEVRKAGLDQDSWIKTLVNGISGEFLEIDLLFNQAELAPQYFKQLNLKDCQRFPEVLQVIESNQEALDKSIQAIVKSLLGETDSINSLMDLKDLIRFIPSQH